MKGLIKEIKMPKLEGNNGIRLQKYLSSIGFSSRRAVENLITREKVNVNGRKAYLGLRVKEGDVISVSNEFKCKVEMKRKKTRVLIFNKPIGKICSKTSDEKFESIYNDLPSLKGASWISIGRLDVNTSGLLLLTNDGDFASRLTHPSSNIDREYVVRVFGRNQDEAIFRLKNGVIHQDTKYRFLDIRKGRATGQNRWYTCVLQSGRYREIRRAFESQGLSVNRLKRVRYGNILLPTDLPAGKTVEIGGRLLLDLFDLVGHPGHKYNN